MRICQVVDTFPPGRWGGSKVHNYTLVKYLLEKGYDVDVIVLRVEDIPKKTLIDASNTINKGIRVYDIFPKAVRFIGPLSWMHQIKAKINEIERKKGKIDVFDVHNSYFLLPFVFEKRNIIFSLHFFELTCPLPIGWYTWPRPCRYSSFRKCWECSKIDCSTYLNWKLVKKYAINKSTKIMVKNSFLKSVLVEKGVDAEKIFVVPNWIDIRSINEKSKQKLTDSVERFAKTDKVFLFFGRLSQEKGLFLLLKAFALLDKKVSNVKLVLIGDGPLRQRLRDFCKENNLENKVAFLGMIPYTEIHRYLTLADFIIFPQLYYNYEWSLLEAMSTEKPIIATNVPGTSDILKNNYNAFLTSPTPGSLSDGMFHALNNLKLAEKIAMNAFETVKNKHSLENLKKYEELIHSIVMP